MIRETAFTAHWRALDGRRAGADLPPATAGEARRHFNASQRAASPSGYLDWLTRTDAYLEALGKPRSDRDEVLVLWRDGWDPDAAAHLLTRKRACGHCGAT
jgi:hypothetical protein